MTIHQKYFILEIISGGDFVLTHHAYERMQERSITREDIKTCAKTAKEFKTQADGKFLIMGFDLCDEETSIVCALKDNVVIITVY